MHFDFIGRIIRRLILFIFCVLFLFIGYTYVRAQSPGLDRTLRQELAAFSNDLRRNSGTDRGTGQVSLEFYQRKKRWLVQAEDIPWEVCIYFYFGMILHYDT